MILKRKILLSVIATLLLGVGVWAATDLWGPRAISLRRFDPDDVARLETAMWRSYYDKQRLRMFNEMAELLRHQFHMPLLRSYVVGFYAAKAAFIFKDGTTRKDYERALPDLREYYSAIHRVSDAPFDVEVAARLELEWWIIHRQRASYQPGDLDAALAKLAAETYRMPAERFLEHAKFRAEAMTLRDELAEQNQVSEADWQKINELLVHSWRALWLAVNDNAFNVAKLVMPIRPSIPAGRSGRRFDLDGLVNDHLYSPIENFTS